MFWDLNVLYGSKLQAKELLCSAIRLGYDGIAFCYETQKLSPKDVNVMQPVNLDDLPAKSAPNTQAVLRSQRSSKPFQQYFRITVQLDDQSQVHGLSPSSSLSHDVLRSYDIVAVAPSTEKLFHACCSTLDLDIISLDFSRRLPFHIKRPAVGMAVERGVFFEVTYSASLKDVSARRNLMSNMLNFVYVTRGKNIIISSRAVAALDLRGPYDVVNICVMFGMKPDEAKKSISSHCFSAIQHGATRRTVKSVIEFVDVGAQNNSSSSTSSSSSSSALNPLQKKRSASDSGGTQPAKKQKM